MRKPGKEHKRGFAKKGLSIALAMLLGLSLAACGKEGDASASGESVSDVTDDYVYVPEFQVLEAEENADISRVKFQGEELYYMLYRYDEETEESTNVFVRRALNDLEKEEVLTVDFQVPEGYDAYMGEFFFDEAGSLYAVWSVSPVYVEGQEYDYSDNSTWLVRYADDLSEEWSADLGEVFADEDNRYIQSAVAGGEGKLYLSSNNVVYVFDSAGNYVKTIPVNADWINGLTVTADGRVFVVQYGDIGLELTEMDTASDTLSGTFKNLPDTNEAIRAGREGTLLVSGYSKLYEYDLATQESTVVLNWVDCNIQGSYAREFVLQEDGRIVVVSDNYEDKPEIVYLTRTDAAKVPQKKVLTLGTLYEDNGNLQKAVVNFNKANTEYQVKIKGYVDESAEWTEHTYSDAIALLNADLVSDNCPDLIDLSQVDMDNLAAKGVLEDLAPYLEASEKANLKDFVPSVLNAYRVNGIQVTVPRYFTIETLLARTSVVGSEPGWTMEEMIALSDANPDAVLLYGMTKDRALQLCLQYASDSFIDYQTASCSFDSPAFVQILEFADRFDMEYQYNEEESFPNMLQSGKLLLSDASFDNVQAYQMYHLMFEGDEVTPIGYPTSDGTPGVFLSGSEVYGISLKSAYKEGAWAFLESVLSAERNEHAWGFPSRTAYLEAMFAQDCQPEYQYDENGEILKDAEGNPVENSKTSWSYDNWNVEIYAASEEEIDGVRALIEAARPFSRGNDEIFTMISEEAASYFAGQKSAEEVAKIIQSRVELYVSENS